MRNIYIIVNPLAGDKRSIIVAKRVIRSLNNNKFNFKHKFLRKDEKISDIIHEIDDSFEYILVIGGDGTVRSVVEGLILHRKTHKLACFPGGTGSELSIYANTTTIKNLITALRSGNTIKVDIFLAKINLRNEKSFFKYFIANLQIGHFALGIKETPSIAKRLFYGSGYMVGIIKAIIKRRNRFAAVFGDNKRVFLGKIYTIHLGNVPTTRGGVPIAPLANPMDSLIDVMLVKALSRSEAFSALPSALNGTHLSHPAVIYKQFSKVHIISEGDHLAIDGEYLGLFRELIVTNAGKIDLLFSAIQNQPT